MLIDVGKAHIDMKSENGELEARSIPQGLILENPQLLARRDVHRAPSSISTITSAEAVMTDAHPAPCDLRERHQIPAQPLKKQIRTRYRLSLSWKL